MASAVRRDEEMQTGFLDRTRHEDIDDDKMRKEFAMSGYCMKCRAHREMQEPEEVTLKNGRLATRGKCGECGATMFRMGGTTVKG